MHHGTCVTHVPWCMSGSLARCGGENVPGIPAPAILRIWQEAHGVTTRKHLLLYWSLWRSSAVHRWIPLTKVQLSRALVFSPLFSMKKMNKESIWRNTMTLMRSDWNDKSFNNFMLSLRVEIDKGCIRLTVSTILCVRQITHVTFRIHGLCLTNTP